MAASNAGTSNSIASIDVPANPFVWRIGPVMRIFERLTGFSWLLITIAGSV
jgi:hypothetical protein